MIHPGRQLIRDRAPVNHDTDLENAMLSRRDSVVSLLVSGLVALSFWLLLSITEAYVLRLGDLPHRLLFLPVRELQLRLAVLALLLLFVLVICYRSLYQVRTSTETLSGQEDLLRQIVEHSNDGVAVVSKEGTIRYISPAIQALFGYTAEEIKTVENWARLVAPNESTRREILDDWAHDAASGSAPERVYPVMHRNGHHLWCRLKAAPAGGDNLVVNALDVTKQTETVEALRRSEEHYSALFHHSNDAIVLHGLNGQIVDANARALEMFEYTLEEIRKLTIAHLHPPEMSGASQFAFDRIKRKGSIDFEILFCRKDGTRFPAEVSSSIHDVHGRKVIQGIVRDISRRKKAEEALARERDRLRVTLRSIAEGVVSTDKVGKITLINRIAESLTGWSSQEAVGRNIDDVLILTDERSGARVTNPAISVLRSRSLLSQNHIALLGGRAGAPKPVSCSAAPIHGPGRQLVGAVLVFRDISESRAVERELQKVHNLESLGLLAGGIAHDFNNILTGILANTSLARSMAKDLPDVDEVLGDSETACRRARDLTRQLLTFSRGGTPVKKTASATALIKEAASLALRGSNATCEIVPTDHLWPVKVDEGQMNQVLNNLLINADQAMPQGGTITIKSENVAVADGSSGPLKPGDYVKVTIQDCGAGIPPENLPKVFDPYFTTKQDGSGLGLATSYSIIKKHEGYITVESKQAEGSTFVVYLPAVRHAVELAPASTAPVPKGRGRILLMDDEEIVRKAAALLLRKLGYEATCVADGRTAVQCYGQALRSAQPFDAVVLDLTVPKGMGGKQTIRELRALDPDIRAIVSSGYSNDPVMADAAAYGFKAVVRKPYDIEALARTLNRVVGTPDQETDAAML